MADDPVPQKRPVDFMEDDDIIAEALHKAMKAAIRRHKLLGESIAWWVDGKATMIPAEEIPDSVLED